MKRKLRDRLGSIERALKELTKKVRGIDLTQLPVSKGDDDRKARGSAPPRKTQKEAVKAAIGKTGKRTKR
jgi:hypothetical protein